MLTRDNFLNIRLLKAERRAIEALARQEYKRPSVLVREVVLDRARSVGLWPPAEVREGSTNREN